MSNEIITNTVMPSDDIKTLELYIRMLPHELQQHILEFALDKYHSLGETLPKLDDLIISKKTSKDWRVEFPFSNNYRRKTEYRGIIDDITKPSQVFQWSPYCKCNTLDFNYRDMSRIWNVKHADHEICVALDEYMGICYNGCRPTGLYNENVNHFLKYETDQSVLYTGWVSIYSNKITKLFEGQFKNGKAHGFGYEYHNDESNCPGNYKYKGMFQNGKYHGIGEQYDVDENIRYEGDFENGMRSGNGWLYSEDRNTHYSGEFKYDKKHGSGEEYYDHGVIQYEGGFNMGSRFGFGEEFDEYGNIEYSGEIYNGLRHGVGEEFYSNGMIKYEGDYFDGERRGEGLSYPDDWYSTKIS
jgi:antitoxin component YwqK of YwqJK toxin-antitoxin module